MYRAVLSIFALCTVAGCVWADDVAISNIGGDALYVALYDYNNVTGSAVRVSDPEQVEADARVTLASPRKPLARRATHTRTLAYDEQKNRLQEKLDKQAWRELSSIPVGKAEKLEIPRTQEVQAVKDHVTITNVTEQPWFVATYVVPHARNKAAQRYSDVVRVEPEASVSVPRPDFTWKETFNKDRLILFHENGQALTERMAYGERTKLPYIKAGTAQGSVFFIAPNVDGAAQGYNLLSWKTRNVRSAVAKALEGVFEAAVDPFVQKIRKKYLDPAVNPWAKETAEVRTGKGQSQYEEQVVAKRDASVRKAVGQLLGRELKDDEPTPRIALVCSGGGFRAMFATLGTMQAAHEEHLWDALTYVASLSGSTWAIAPYMTSDASLPEFVESAVQRATKGFADISKDMRFAGDKHAHFMEQLANRIAFQQTLSLIDPYGYLLGWHLLKDIRKGQRYLHPQAVTLAQQRERVDEGGDPLPIYTAVVGQTERAATGYTWMFFTPYEVGGYNFGGYAPSWGVARTYNQGRSVNSAPPYTLGYCMGIWGSAFSGSFQDVYSMMLQGINIPIVKKVFQGVSDAKLGNQRLLPAQVPNFTYNMENAPLRRRKYVSLIDGGFASNLPAAAVIPPEREVDVLIALDVSGDIATSPELGELQKAVEIAENRNVPIPDIDYKQAYNNVASLFRSNDPNSPSLVYMPMIRNSNYGEFDPRENLRRDGFLRTTNFTYTREQADTYMQLHKQNLKDAMPKISQAVEHAIAQKKR